MSRCDRNARRWGDTGMGGYTFTKESGFAVTPGWNSRVKYEPRVNDQSSVWRRDVGFHDGSQGEVILIWSSRVPTCSGDWYPPGHRRGA